MNFKPYICLIATRSSWLEVIARIASVLMVLPRTSLAHEAIPQDTCIVVVDAPSDASVTLGGRFYGIQHTIRYRMPPDATLRKVSLAITFKNGTRTEKQLQLRGGWNVVVPLLKGNLPESVPQTGHRCLTCIALSEDKRYVATGASDNTAILWDIASGLQLRTFRGHTHSVTDVKITSDGSRVLTSSGDQTTALWDSKSGQRLKSYGGGSQRVAFIGDEQQVWVSVGPFSYFLNSIAGSTERTLHSGATNAALSRNGIRMAVAHNSKNLVSLWDLQEGKKLRELPNQGKVGEQLSVAIDGSGHRILAGSSDKMAILWNADTGEKQHVFAGHQNCVVGVALSGDGLIALTVSEEGSAFLWDTETGQSRRILRSISDDYQTTVTCVALTTDGKLAAVGDDSSRFTIWNCDTGDEIFSFAGGGEGEGPVHVNENNHQLVSGRSIWNIQSGQSLESFFDQPGDFVASSDGRRCLVSGRDTVVWDRVAGQECAKLIGDKSYPPWNKLSGDGTVAMTLHHEQDSKTLAWDAETGAKTGELKGSNGRIFLSYDGRLALNSTGILWDIPTGSKVHELQQWPEKQGDIALNVVFSKDRQLVLVGFHPDKAILWDVPTGRMLHILTGHSWAVDAVAISDKNRNAMTGARDQTAILWDVGTGKPIRHFTGHAGYVLGVDVTEDGRLAITSAADGTRVFDVATGDEVAKLIPLQGGRDWLVITPDGLFDGSYGGRQKVMVRIGEGLSVVPVDRFFQDLYFPGLLAAIWRGERPMPRIHLGDTLPPSLAIDSPQVGGDVDDRRVTVTVTATDKGGGIKGPSIRHNGATLIGAVQTTERIETGVQRTFAVNLIEGENTLEVISASADGSFESEPVRTVLHYNKPLPKSRLHVLTVGIDDYPDEALKMNYAVSDADGIADVFASRGGSLYEDILVTPLKNSAATREGIFQGIQSLAANSSPQDTAVVFLSGHGTMVDQNFYFVPHDFHRTSVSLEEDLRHLALAAADLGERLAQVPALKRMMVFDTGQSGQALPVQKLTRNPFAFRGAVERLSRAQGVFTLASAAVSDKAVEVDELRHGVLSYSFLAGLKAVETGPLVNEWVRPIQGENVAQALDLFSFTSSRSRQLGHRYFGQEQDVQYSSSGMTFPVLPVDSSSLTPSPAAAAARVRPAHPVVPLVSASSRPSTAMQGTLHVIAIGISDYSESSMNLKYAASDAKAIGELFQSRHAALFDNVRLTILLNDRATRQEILNAVSQVAEAAEAGDTLAVFLAGHGAMVGQRYYFIPADFENSSGESTDNAVRTMGLAADELGDAISRIPASRRILVFDTCASGAAIHLSKQGNDPFAFRSAIEQIGKDGGTFTLGAVGSSEVAQEVDELQHGVLSYCLLAGAGAIEFGPLAGRPLQSASADSVDVLEWFSYAAGHVPRLTSQYFHQEQQAQLGGTGKSFDVFSRQRATAKEEE